MSRTYKRRHSAGVKRETRKLETLKTHKQRRVNRRIKIRKENYPK